MYINIGAIFVFYVREQGCHLPRGGTRGNLIQFNAHNICAYKKKEKLCVINNRRLPISPIYLKNVLNCC